MKQEKQAKLSKLYRGDLFIGFGLTVDGQLLSDQVKVTIDPSGEKSLLQVTVVFDCHSNLMNDAPDIYLT